MPIYQCISPEGLLDESTRGKLAEEITVRNSPTFENQVRLSKMQTW